MESWHGCRKYSAGCVNCYVYRRDESVGRDTSKAMLTASFTEPVAQNRKGKYRIAPGTDVYTCLTSDFFLPHADEWRNKVLDMIRLR